MSSSRMMMYGTVECYRRMCIGYSRELGLGSSEQGQHNTGRGGAVRCIGVSADASENRERAPKTIRGAVARCLSRGTRVIIFRR